MSDEARDRFEMPKEMRSMAEASVEQARKTFEKFLESAEATAGSIEERGATVRAGAKDVSAKAFANAEKNVQASLDYAQSLLQAKDLPDVMRLHSEFVQAQMRALAEQWARLSVVPQWRRRSRRFEQPRTRNRWNYQTEVRDWNHGWIGLACRIAPKISLQCTK